MRLFSTGRVFVIMVDVHWADAIAGALCEVGNGDSHVVASGITPSGEIHIGNMREVVTADAVYRALEDRGTDVRLIYIADTFDPLRTVYPFLPETYREEVGKPLFKIPCPCGDHDNYAEHFLEPFLESLELLEIDAEILRADELYESGEYRGAILRALEEEESIARILEETSHRSLPGGWSPFNPLCPECERIVGTRVLGFNSEEESVDVACTCGFQGVVSVVGGGKLTWRVDWPARWEILGVTVEPFGKDHATRGGSYDTGKRIAEEVYRYRAPYPIIYEWIMLKGKGAMHSSKGVLISITEMLEVLPPEVLRYLIIRSKPEKHIEFDPGIPLLNLIDEYDRRANPRAHELSQTKRAEDTAIPFRHLVTAVQVTRETDALLGILERSGYDTSDSRAVLARAENAQRWVERYAPPNLKFKVYKELPQAVRSFDSIERELLGVLAKEIKGWKTPQEIHDGIYKIAKETGIEPKRFFQTIYTTLLSAKSGPRLGYFLASLDNDFLVKRFNQAANSQSDSD